MTMPRAGETVGAGLTLCNSPGNTRHCCPFSAITVTDFRFYHVTIPYDMPLPSDSNETRSPMLNSSIDACARISRRNLSRATIRLFQIDQFGFR